jgi:hypothetical protein
MKFFIFVLAALFCSISTADPQQQASATRAISANTFVDSIGVNIHLHHADTPYGNFAAVRDALQTLGVHHIRDGLIDTTWTAYYDRLNELGHIGIKATLITSPKQSPALLVDYPRRVPDAFEAYEAPNELDINGDPRWAATLKAFLPVLHNVAGASSAARIFPIIGPSLTQPNSFPELAGSQQFFDSANLHNYMGGRNPGTPGWGDHGYGSFQWHLDHATHAWPGKPIVTTETGYFNDLSKSDAVPERIAGKYIPRLLFEQTLHGIQRTYIYELVDLGRPGQPGDTTYGLLHSDFTPKPAFLAVQSILQLLRDPGPDFHVGQLNFILAGELSNVHRLLLQKRNGDFYLAVWIEQPGYDVNTRKLLEVPGQNVALQLSQPARIIRNSLDEDGKMERSEPVTGAAYKFKVSDCITILQIAPRPTK